MNAGDEKKSTVKNISNFIQRPLSVLWVISFISQMDFSRSNIAWLADHTYKLKYPMVIIWAKWADTFKLKSALYE